MSEINNKPTLECISDIDKNQRIIFVGGSNVGKSTLINALLNKSVEKHKLTGPAAIMDPMVSNGCTNSVMSYYDGKHFLLDTIGFTDPRLIDSQRISSFYELLFNFKIGFNLIIVVFKHRVFTNEEKKLYQLYEIIFGKDFYKNSLLYINDVPDIYMDVEKYLELQSCPNWKERLSKFGKDRIILGNLQQHNNEIIEGQCEIIRKKSKLSVLNWINKNAQDTLKELKILNLSNILKMISRFFNLFVMTEFERIYACFIGNLEERKLMYYGEKQCTICLEHVVKDVFISPCLHIFHFDCMKVWHERNPTCPVCRKPVTSVCILPQTKTQSHEKIII